MLSTSASVGGGIAQALGNFNTTVTPLGGTAFASDVSYIGLPVIGFALESYNNGTLTEGDGSLVQSNYGGNFLHKGTRSIFQFAVP